MELQILSLNIANLIKVLYNTFGDIMNKYFSHSQYGLKCHYYCDEKPDKESFKLHTHDTFELYIFVYGKGKFLIEGNEYPLSHGDIILLRPTEAHYIDIDDSRPYERFSAHFSEDFFKTFDKESLLLEPFLNREAGTFNHYSRDDFKPEIYNLLVNNLLGETQNRHLQVSCNLLTLLNEIYKVYKSNRDTATQGESLTQQIVRYINNHINDNITLDTICNKFYISKPQLCRNFKAATGSTVQNYINAKRLVNAKRMMANGILPTRAAVLCGFNDYSVFYRAFFKEYGKAPKKEYNKI